MNEREREREREREQEQEHTTMSDSDIERGSGDAERVRGALRRHRWPEPGDALMARLRAIPDHASNQVESESGDGRDLRDRRADAPVRGVFSPRPSGRLEALGAVAIVAAVVFVILRGTGGGIAPADEPERAGADGTRTAEAYPGAAATPAAGSEADADADVEDGPSAGSMADRGQPAPEAAGLQPTSAAPPPEPPEGVRLYGSVAELLDDPPAPGESVWVDAYHGEVILTYPGWGRASSMWGCPVRSESPLLDQPHLLQIATFDGVFGTKPPDPASESMLVAAGVDAEGDYTTMPDLPRRGRLVVRLGDPAMSDCEEADRIAVVERVAHVFEAKTDWAALANSIRTYESKGEASGATHVSDPDGGADLVVGAYAVGIPEPLEVLNTVDVAPDLGYVDMALAMPALPGHPIVLRRYRPGHPEHAGMIGRVEAGIAGRTVPVYRQRPIDGNAGDAPATAPQIEFAIDGLVDDSGGRIPLGDGEISALTAVDDVVYRISVTPPADPLQAQPLLWWLETVVDRFRVPVGSETGGTVIEGPSGATLGFAGAIGVGFEPTVAATAGDAVVIGGFGGLAVADLDAYMLPTGMRSYRPVPPATLGVVGDADVEALAARTTGGDVDAARARLSEPGEWGVQAVAISEGYAYAAIEAPPSSGIVALHVIDRATIELGLTDVVRLPAEPVGGGAFTVWDMALLGDGTDRLLVASSAGVFVADVRDPAAVVVAPISPDLRSMTHGLAAAPDSRRAWATIPLIDHGGLVALDVSDPTGVRGARTLAADAAFFDIATDGRSAFVTTGSADDHVRAYDVRGDGDPRLLAAFRLEAEMGHHLALLGDRLVVAATNLPGESAYPPPAERPELGPVGLAVYDVADPAAPSLVETVGLPGGAADLTVGGEILLVPVASERQVRLYRLVFGPSTDSGAYPAP